MTMTPTAVTGLWRLSTGEYVNTKDEAAKVLEMARQPARKEDSNDNRR